MYYTESTGLKHFNHSSQTLFWFLGSSSPVTGQCLSDFGVRENTPTKPSSFKRTQSSLQAVSKFRLVFFYFSQVAVMNTDRQSCISIQRMVGSCLTCSFISTFPTPNTVRLLILKNNQPNWVKSTHLLYLLLSVRVEKNNPLCF